MTTLAADLAYTDALAAASTTFDAAIAVRRGRLDDLDAAYADARDARATRDAAYADARRTYIDARAADATPTNPLLAAAPALLAAARQALEYLETLPYQPSIHPSTKAQDALHDAIVAAQGFPV
jgi:hypothetical protein